MNLRAAALAASVAVAACAPRSSVSTPALEVTYRDLRVPSSSVLVQAGGTYAGAVPQVDIERRPCRARAVQGTLSAADAARVDAAAHRVWESGSRLGVASSPPAFPSDSLTVSARTQTPGTVVLVVRQVWNRADPQADVQRALGILRALIPCR